MESTGSRTLNVETIKKVASIICLFILIFTAAWVRFDGITEQGINAGDGFGYLIKAEAVASGTFDIEKRIFYRPVAYYLQGWAVKVFGYNDYSIKILNASSDMLSIILIISIGSLIAGNLWFGLSCGLIYAFLPRVVYLSRMEMVHSETSFLVLLATLMMVLWYKYKNSALPSFFCISGAGIFISLAAQTHTEIAFLAIGCVLFIIVALVDTGDKKKSIAASFKAAFYFSISFFAAYLVIFILLGFSDSLQVFISEIAQNKDVLKNRYGEVSMPLLFWDIINHTLSYYFRGKKNLFLIALILTIPIALFHFHYKKSQNLCYYLCASLFISYALLYSILLDNFVLASGRIAMPVLPLIVIHILLWFFIFFNTLTKKYSEIIYIIMVVFVFLLIPKKTQPMPAFKSLYRHAFDIIGEQVDSSHKLLIAPAAVYSFDDGFNSDIYFGQNALYLCNVEIKDRYNLDVLVKIIVENDIKYIYITNHNWIDKRKLDQQFLPPFIDEIKPKRIRERLNKSPSKAYRLQKRISYPTWFLNSEFRYSLEEDYNIIDEFLKNTDAVLIESSRFGKIYSLIGRDIVNHENVEKK